MQTLYTTVGLGVPKGQEEFMAWHIVKTFEVFKYAVPLGEDTKHYEHIYYVAGVIANPDNTIEYVKLAFDEWVGDLRAQDPSLVEARMWIESVQNIGTIRQTPEHCVSFDPESI